MREWKIEEPCECVSHIEIDKCHYFMEYEKACLIQAILLLAEEVSNVKNELQLIGEKMHVRR